MVYGNVRPLPKRLILDDNLCFAHLSERADERVSMNLCRPDLLNRPTKLIDLITEMIPRPRINNRHGGRDHEPRGAPDRGCGARRGLHDSFGPG